MPVGVVDYFIGVSGTALKNTKVWDRR
jgi:hypothetical protein